MRNILGIFKEFPSWWYSNTLNWFTNFLFSYLQNSIKNIQTNRLRILEPSVNNSIFCKEFKRHFVNVNIWTLLIYRYTCWLLKALSFHKDDRTCEIEKDYIIDPFNNSNAQKVEHTREIEKDDIIDPFNKSNPFNRVRLVSGYSQPWIGFILKDCPMDNVHSTPWWSKAISVHKVERTCWIW